MLPLHSSLGDIPHDIVELQHVVLPCLDIVFLAEIVHQLLTPRDIVLIGPSAPGLARAERMKKRRTR